MSFAIDRYAHTDSFLKRWDTRCKIIALGSFMISIALVQSLVGILVCAVGVIVLIGTSQLPWSFFKSATSWVAYFLLPFFVFLPFTFSGEVLFTLFSLDFSAEGLRLSLLIFLKALAIVLTNLALLGSARFDQSVMALQALRCPAFFVQMLLYTYRYIFVFLSELERMQMAMGARGFTPKLNVTTLRTLGHGVATLLIRSFERADRVYKAMLSKGYTGIYHSMVTFKADARDIVLCSAFVAGSIGLWIIDRLAGFKPALEAWW